MNPQELYEAYMSVYEDEDRREMRRLASQERQAEKKAESEFRSKSGIGAKKKGPKLSATKMSKGEGENYAKQTMKDAEHIAKKAKGHTVGNPFPEEFDYFDQVLSELIDAGYTAEEALAYMVQEAQQLDEISTALKRRAADASVEKVHRAEKSYKDASPTTKPYVGRKLDKAVAQHKRLAKVAKEEIDVNEAQYARNNPEKYEREQEKKQSSRERRMNDPKTGINSKAFNDFYNAQMRRKKA